MYAQSITRNNRTVFVIAVDQSGSMAEELQFRGHTVSKATVVAEVTNRLLFELIERARRSDGIRDYYDIAVIAYGADEVTNLFDCQNGFITVNDLAQISPEQHSTAAEITLPDGTTALRTTIVPQWIAPKAAGKTPMFSAMQEVLGITERWCADPAHRQSFPPIVFNITDGEASDCSDNEMMSVADRIKSLHTADGNVLMINIHIASCGGAASVIFPTRGEIAYANRYAQLLFDCSSEMPDPFNDAIRSMRGVRFAAPFRGMSYNASIEELIAVLNIGSISVAIQ